MLRRIGIIAVLSLLAVALAVPAFAQNPHFVRAPVGTDQGTVLTVTGKAAGLGDGPFFGEILATGIAEVECANPAGNVAPGQDTEVTAQGISGPLQPTGAGQLTFSVTTVVPTVTGAEACPNPKWTARVTDVKFTSATFLLYEGSATGPVVLSSPVTIR
jgi:hypothetical protein